jgi:peptide/nickel transport system substrate-binding protein
VHHASAILGGASVADATNGLGQGRTETTRSLKMRLTPRSANRQRLRIARRSTAILSAVVIGTLTLAACEGGGGSGAAGQTLTIAFSPAPANLDLPTNCQTPMFLLSYEPLIRVSSTGAYEPGIAESWEYSKNNTVFTMKIRKGVKFQDGSDVTVQSVVDTLNYYKTTPGLNQGYLKPLTIKALDDTTVEISYAEPFRGMETLLANDGECNNGDIISAAGLKDPGKMKTDTFGAGPYEYDAGESEPGDHYVFTKSKTYYEPSRQHWDKVVVRIIDDANTAYNALVTGQVQVDMVGGELLVDRAKGKGFDVNEGLALGTGGMLFDRGGEVSKPLADERVRQALGYALDRDSIAKVVGPYSKPLDQFSLPNLPGADPNLPTKYTYDLAKAKALLAAAGHPNGFAVTMFINAGDANGKNALNAAVEQWAKIGVKVTIKQEGGSSYYATLATKKYPMGGASYALLGDTYFDAVRLYKAPYSDVWNPFRSTDPDLDKAYSAIATADGASIEATSRNFNEVMTKKAWYVPISFSYAFVFSKGIEIGTASPLGQFDVANWKAK